MRDSRKYVGIGQLLSASASKPRLAGGRRRPRCLKCGRTDLGSQTDCNRKPETIHGNRDGKHSRHSSPHVAATKGERSHAPKRAAAIAGKRLASSLHRLPTMRTPLRVPARLQK